MAKSNKAAKKAANLAKKNAEALAKAKKAAQKEEAKVVETTVVEPEKKEETKVESKQTPYESYMAYKSNPHMGMLFQTIEKDDHGIEQITTKWKNHETNETFETKFPTSNVKKGDGIELDKLREQAEKGLKEYYAEKKAKETPKEEKKVETKKEEKKTAKKKDQVIIPETVEPKTATPSKKIDSMTITKGLAALANHERIDENHQIDFLKLMSEAYLSNPDAKISPEQKAAYQEVFDGGMCQLTLLYAAQLEEEGRAILKGVSVTKEVFPLAKQQFCEMYGVDVKALPGKKDGQMTIEFETVPEEVKEAAKADAKAVTKGIPEASTELSEEEKLNAVRAILSRNNASDGYVPCRMATNIHDALTWARIAFDIKSEEPQVTLATLYQKFNNTKTLCLSGYMRKAWGATNANHSPFITHALIHKDFEGMPYTEKQIAEMVKVMIAAYAETSVTPENDFAKCILPVNTITSSMTADIIKKIVKKDELINKTIPGAKIYNSVANVYGNSESPKLLRGKLDELAGYYKSPIQKLANYADESAYSKK